jgi:hypothetical protein
LSILALFFTLAIQAADDVPKRPEFSRYSAMLNRSPFAVATAVAAPAATPNFARDLYVANAAHTEEGDLVTIVSGSDRNSKEYLSTKGPNDHGYSISNIQWSDKPGETKVTITKDGQFATLPFNQALLAPPSSNTQSQAQQPQLQPPQPVQQSIIPPPPPNPNISMPKPGTIPAQTPHVRGVIQRNPAVRAPTPMPTPYAPPAAANDDE